MREIFIAVFERYIPADTYEEANEIAESMLSEMRDKDVTGSHEVDLVDVEQETE